MIQWIENFEIQSIVMKNFEEKVVEGYLYKVVYNWCSAQKAMCCAALSASVWWAVSSEEHQFHIIE